MARQKWCRNYKATTAFTVHLVDKMGLKEVEDRDNIERWLANNGKKDVFTLTLGLLPRRLWPLKKNLACISQALSKRPTNTFLGMRSVGR